MKKLLEKELENFARINGRVLVGAIKIQCPVYAVHLKMKVTDSDSFFPMDRAILSFIKIQPDTNKAFLANMIGVDYHTVEWRFECLMNEQKISIPDGKKYIVTEKGEALYFSENKERPEVTERKDIAVDGISLDFLGDEFYEGRIALRDKKADVISHKPLMGDKDPALLRLAARFESMSASIKGKYQMKADAHDFEVDGYDTLCIDNIHIVFTTDDRGIPHRDLVFKGKRVSIPSLEGYLPNYYFSLANGEFHSSEGYIELTNHPITNFSYTDIAEFFKRRYGLKDIEDGSIKYTGKYNETSGYPLRFYVSLQTLMHARNRYQLVTDMKNGKFSSIIKEGTYKNQQGGFFITGVDYSDSLQVILDWDDKIQNWKEEHGGTIDYGFVEACGVGDDKEWRNLFILLGRHEELEEIDIHQFINIDEDE